MPKQLNEALAEHKERQAKEPRFSPDFRVCGGLSCLSDTSIKNKNRLFSSRAGLPHIRIHDFRHPYVKLTTKNKATFRSDSTGSRFISYRHITALSKMSKPE